MSDHTTIRLEKAYDDGTSDVVAYFAPNFEVQPVVQHEIASVAATSQREPTARDRRRITEEVTVQGAFEHSENLPGGHKSDLENLFGTVPVTAQDQVNRIKHYLYDVGGPYELYVGPDEYTATSDSAIDRANGINPTVQIGELRPPKQASLSRQSYTVKFEVGLE